MAKQQLPATPRTIAETHVAGCPLPGFRHGFTRKSDGKVVLFCKNSHCSAMRIV